MRRLLLAVLFVALAAPAGAAEPALRERLRQRDHVLVYASAESTTPEEIKVYGTAPAEVSGAARTAAIRRDERSVLPALADPDRSARLAAIAILAEAPASAPLGEIVRRGLGHPDPDTRAAVLAAGFPLGEDVLVHHALHDAAPAVRRQALGRLAGAVLDEDVIERVRLTGLEPEALGIRTRAAH